ncbi:hypothetical protein M3210_11330 [Oceanobacillus luteolus]|uniref:Uncharacterized protein n=1 Tax=Oceanobacillus luteolus TaxID=1274358 RepID=A0ABW4HWC6_9BACI|nr:hypothetical protein [Oceanobacillus luteolus]MCM3740865.1 hypothetical protein [Oceanobacillus luteolus]
MFEATFTAELARRLGATVEVTTDSNVIEGILSTVTGDLVLVIEVTSGYGTTTKQYVAASAINYVRFPVAV